MATYLRVDLDIYKVPTFAGTITGSLPVDRELIGRIPTINDTSSAITFDYVNYAGKIIQDKPGDPI
jgi:hypothetical protein